MRNTQPAERQCGIELETDVAQKWAHRVVQSARGNPSAAFEALVADRQVFRNGEMSEEIEFLEDDAKSRPPRGVRSVPDDRPTVEKDFSLIGSRNAAEDSRQGAFARAILTTEGMDLAGKQLPAYPLKGGDTPVVLMDIPAFEHKDL